MSPRGRQQGPCLGPWRRGSGQAPGRAVSGHVRFSQRDAPRPEAGSPLTPEGTGSGRVAGGLGVPGACLRTALRWPRIPPSLRSPGCGGASADAGPGQRAPWPGGGRAVGRQVGPSLPHHVAAGLRPGAWGGSGHAGCLPGIAGGGVATVAPCLFLSEFEGDGRDLAAGAGGGVCEARDAAARVGRA